MGKFGKCCCVGDCLTPFECDTWGVSWDGYTPTITNAWQTIETTTASGNTLVASVASQSCGGPNVGSISIDAYYAYTYEYRLRIRKGHRTPGISCATWPTGFTGPASKALNYGSDTGISTYKVGSQCYAVFHVGIEVYLEVIRTLETTQTISGFTGGLVSCNNTRTISITCLTPGLLNAVLCTRITNVLGFTSEPIPYSVLTDLNGTHTLYFNPVQSPPFLPCSLTGPIYRAALLLPTQSQINAQIRPLSCFAICPVPFAVSGGFAWTQVTQQGTQLPSTMTVTLGGCKSAVVVPD